MRKNILCILLAIVFAVSLNGCTSKKATEETTADMAEVSEDGMDTESSDMAKSEDSEGLGGEELSPDEKLPEDDIASNEALPEDNSAGSSDEFASPDANNSTPGSEAEKNHEMPSTAETTPPAGDMTQTPPPMTETPSEVMPTEEMPPKASVSLKKVVDAPYDQSGINVNTVYLARKGDTLDTVATKIYGTTDKKPELVKINSFLKSREVKVGDKIYYSSPHRAADKERMLTFYEDMGATAQTYVVSKPENISDVAKNLLGDSNSWKELWATNMEVESKGVLPEGTQLRYWSGPVAAPTLAEGPKNNSMDEIGEVPPQPNQNLAQTPPPAGGMEPQEHMGQGGLPPQEQGSMGSGGAPQPQAEVPPPPPPEPVHEMSPPPPPPPPVAETQTKESGEGNSIMGFLENPDQTMTIGVAAIVLLGAVALFVVIRKRRARRNIDFHTSTQTQIE